ncbi:hypothetical protein PG997_000227 [Apiospora hydei]|uniref:Uncharacterized protein n=1 Tax=Apiospora hydei TaxID=1337664 RepID=A0ABR1XAE1_9PEZI
MSFMLCLNYRTHPRQVVSLSPTGLGHLVLPASLADFGHGVSKGLNHHLVVQRPDGLLDLALVLAPPVRLLDAQVLHPAVLLDGLARHVAHPGLDHGHDPAERGRYLAPRPVPAEDLPRVGHVVVRAVDRQLIRPLRRRLVGVQRQGPGRARPVERDVHRHVEAELDVRDHDFAARGFVLGVDAAVVVVERALAVARTPEPRLRQHGEREARFGILGHLVRRRLGRGGQVPLAEVADHPGERPVFEHVHGRVRARLLHVHGDAPAELGALRAFELLLQGGFREAQPQPLPFRCLGDEVSPRNRLDGLLGLLCVRAGLGGRGNATGDRLAHVGVALGAVGLLRRIEEELPVKHDDDVVDE